MNDLQIIELYFARDEAAIKETDAKYGKLCFQISNNILHCDPDAEECVNDTYLTVWNQIPPTRPNRFSAFLCRIVRNLSLKRYEYNTAEKRNAAALIPLSELEGVLTDDRIGDGVSDEHLGALISVFLREQKPDVRGVFVRRYFFFDAISDIAARYGFGESKVKSMLFHTRNKLKIFLQKEGITV